MLALLVKVVMAHRYQWDHRQGHHHRTQNCVISTSTIVTTMTTTKVNTHRPPLSTTMQFNNNNNGNKSFDFQCDESSQNTQERIMFLGGVIVALVTASMKQR